MNLNRTITSCLLATLAAPGLRAAPDDPIRLSLDPTTQMLRVEVGMPGAVALAIGPQSLPPIPIAGIFLDVVPHHVVPLGVFEGGSIAQLFVPRALSGLSAEAVLLDPLKGELHDSNVVALENVFADMIDATFRAELVSTDGIPPEFTVGARFTAPTNGYEFLVDGHELDGRTTRVWLHVVMPAEHEIVLPVLTNYSASVELGTDPGEVVEVHVRRTVRGAVGPDVYKRMAMLLVEGGGK